MQIAVCRREGCMSIWQGFNKNKQNPAYIFRVFDLPDIHIKPYESKLSTALSVCKAVALCATRKTYTAINIKKQPDARRLLGD